MCTHNANASFYRDSFGLFLIPDPPWEQLKIIPVG